MKADKLFINMFKEFVFVIFLWRLQYEGIWITDLRDGFQNYATKNTDVNMNKLYIA